ncbi:MAG: hypothetical protein A2600_02380 [Candidatus Lambdaproteobacteria bacterium RIFOXYD1_FULL_56_27]|uniref:Amine oxidase domain-containing protein n=1 Tax=Candidatus Lambdaproteobacteria bacterium RIFOXYD2_FULL_56_26 TaxID=1817773 RepID=A0A1F6H2K1_9PROT|nr:MAG: hypothetical protein A2426_09420 [Candidatus Lambdaproteobacteria bacterium RIFOXYC1_FULL_56_13]OGH04627.1 MAG: hypothetical protein A2557_06445 [Candidatus Lambdaproteobacteria bacterium RIFOXYD2_FULL_56_26]OGH09091.1 MAG: hypothetical protein A2600_02380 [Candidatus Lambdaproteobacteria bacterium RIFOXYD1_FULL_56_27]
MTLPNYINHTGELCFEPPFDLLGTNLYALPVKGDAQKVQATVNQFFGPALAGTGIRYQALGDFVMLALAFCEKATSTDPKARETGWMTENDWAFWVPLLRYNGDKPERLVWFMPFLFVNSPFAMACGREPYGFQKTMAQFSPTTAPADPTDFEVTAWAFKQFGVEQEAVEQLIFSLKATPNPVSKIEALLSDLQAMASDLINLGEIGILGPWELLKALLGDLVKGQIPIVLLKQFRDAVSPKAACYQAVVEAPAQILDLKSVGGLDKIFTLHNPNLASFPFTDALGVPSGATPIGPGLHIYMDFRIEMGKIIAEKKQENPKKVAVLGGGLGALTTLASIVTAPEWNNQYEFTVYERSWRIGGKGASGRNAQENQAIEEHGLHIWLGFYNNAFHLINGAYQATLDLLGYGDLGLTYKDFFSPTDLVVFQENLNAYKGKPGYDWKVWPIKFPDNSEEPGTPDEFLGPIDYAEMLIEMILEIFEEQKEQLLGEFDSEEDQGLFGWVENKIEGAVAAPLIQKIDQLLHDLLEAIQKVAKKIEETEEKDLAGLESWIETLIGDVLQVIGWLQNLMQAILMPVLLRSDLLRRIWMIIDFGLAVAQGMFKDHIFTRGFRNINDLDFYAWLKQNGAGVFTIKGPLIQAVYDIVFGYKNGNNNEPALAAGVGLYGSLRMVMTYKGHIFWRMNMGMGDVIFTPFYELLTSKGVKFKLFQEVKELVMNADGTGIEQIKMNNLIKLKDPAKEYDPFVTLPYHVPQKPGLTLQWPCWPSEINWDQIDPAQAAKLQNFWATKMLNLESNWLPWKDESVPYVLKQGEDYDLVLCGITPRALEPISGQLYAKVPGWKEMLDHSKTVVTRCSELWFHKSSQELGFNPGDPEYKNLEPIIGGYAEPYGSVADLTHLIVQEEWNAGAAPKYLAYPCGPLEMGTMAPTSDSDFPKKTYDAMVADSWVWLNQNAKGLWPNACNPDGSLNPNELVYQYWRAGINYGEHYVLTVPGSPQFRHQPNDFGVANLFIAGDWTQNLINAGCVEGGVISGLNCARFLTGWAIPIYNASVKDLEEGP